MGRVIHVGPGTHGQRELKRLADDIADLGGPKLENRIAKQIRPTIGAKLRADIKASALATLPKRGGLAAKVAARTTTSGGRGVVRIRTSTRYKSDALMDRGIVRHPVFGNREVWVDQRITPGWWSRPVHAAEDDIVREVDRAVGQIIKSLDLD